VPPHLYEPLRQWVDSTYGNERSASDVWNGSRLAAALRYSIRVKPGQHLTVQDVTAYLERRPDVMLDVVDAVLHLLRQASSLPFVSNDYDLDELLILGGSVWRVGPNHDRLVRRVDPTATSAFVEASSPDDTASAELKEAWTAAYARNPNASDAWDHSIKAVETMMIPIVTPNNAKATLSDVVGMLHSQGLRWRLALEGQDGSGSVAPLVSMLRLMWPNPDRHGGQVNRQPSLVEAQAVVHLAVTIMQWARSGVLSKRPLASGSARPSP
jgi:hypothetical protein